VRRARARQGQYKIIGPGDLTDEMNCRGRATSCSASPAHKLGRPSVRDEQEIRRGVKKTNNFRPNFISTGLGRMHMIYEALKKTMAGHTDGEKLIGVMKGMGGRARAADLDRSGKRRHRENIYMKQGRKVERRAVQSRVRDVRSREGTDEGRRV